jgi:hypothetical protein
MKPDFSGEWILDRQASALSSNAAAFQSGVMRIEHRDPTFRFQLSMVAGDKPVNMLEKASQMEKRSLERGR